jgi:tetratricopeptide (TPR) repeat protein
LKQAWELCQADDDLQHEPRGFLRGLRLAKTYFVQGQVKAAFDQLTQVEDILLSEQSPPPESVLECEFLKGWLYLQLENHERSAESFRESAKIASQYLGDEYHMVGFSHTYLGMALEALGHHEEAAASFHKAISTAEPYVDTPYVHYLHYWMYGRSVIGSAAEPDEFDQALEASQRAIEFLSGWPRTWLEPVFHEVIAGAQVRLGDRKSAVRSLKEGLDKAVEPQATWRSTQMDAPTTRRDLEVMLAGLYLNDGKADEARRVLQNGVQERKKLGDDHIQIAMAQLRLGEFLVGQSAYVAAEEPLKDAFDQLEPHPDVVNHLRTRAAAGLVKVYEALNMPEAAVEWRRKFEMFAAFEKP